MDLETANVRKFLLAYADARAELRELLLWLRAQPAVKEVRPYDSSPRRWDPKPESGDDNRLVLFGASVSADFIDGYDAEWWFEISSYETSWKIEYSVSRRPPNEELLHVISDFDDLESDTLEGLIQHLGQVVKDLRASVETPGVISAIAS